MERFVIVPLQVSLMLGLSCWVIWICSRRYDLNWKNWKMMLISTWCFCSHG